MQEALTFCRTMGQLTLDGEYRQTRDELISFTNFSFSFIFMVAATLDEAADDDAAELLLDPLNETRESLGVVEGARMKQEDALDAFFMLENSETAVADKGTEKR